jgi:hypothetical protein
VTTALQDTCARSVEPVEPVELPAWYPLEVPGHGPGIALDLDGAPVWFASRDVGLAASPEAATCLVAYPCLATGRPLRFGGQQPGEHFLASVRGATGLMAGWWGLAPLETMAEPGCPPPPAAAPRARGTALFFSGGLDSYYSLFHFPGIDTLVFISGYDARLTNHAAADRMTAEFRALASRRGQRLVTVATNLRDHPLLGAQRWPRYCGTPQAVVAHLLAREASTFVVSSSHHVSNTMGWGSHPDLDWRWGSDRVTIEHFGATCWRGDKLLALAGQAMVHENLRVCYPAPAEGRNCGRCEKCVRTRLLYHVALPGLPCAALPDDVALDSALDAMSHINEPWLTESYRWALDRASAGDPVAEALGRLVARSEAGDRP